MCDQQGEILDQLTKQCFKCSENCEICNNLIRCRVCKIGFFLNSEGKCKPQKPLKVEMTDNSNYSSLQLSLSFNDSWLLYFSNINSFASIEIDILPKKDFNFNLSEIFKKEKWFLSIIYINILIIIEKELEFKINLFLKSPLTTNDEFFLLNSNFTIKKTICPENHVFNNSKLCKIFITFKIRYFKM